MMSSPLVMLSVGLALAIGGYTLGFFCGKKEMETFTGNLINGVTAGVSGESISVLLSAAAVMNYPEQKDMQQELIRREKSQAMAVKECASIKACASLTAQPISQSALIEQAPGYK